MRGSLRPILVLPLFVSVMGCSSSEPAEEAGPAPSASRPASASPDSVAAWAEEIRAGIARLPRQAADDPDGARRRAVELYVTRQERIEQASGPGTGSAADLAASIHAAEARFHELMQLLGASPPPDSTAVHHAVEPLDARLAEVADLAGGPEPVTGSR